MAQPLIAAAMGVSLSTVNRAHMAYDHGGIKRSSRGQAADASASCQPLQRGFHHRIEPDTRINGQGIGGAHQRRSFKSGSRRSRKKIQSCAQRPPKMNIMSSAANYTIQ